MDSITDQTPTFYEIAMQDRLNDMLWQSIKLIVGVFTEKISALTSLRYYTEEITTILCAGLDFYSMTKTKGTFTESFYSLCRNITSKKSIFAYLFVHYLVPLLVKVPFTRRIYDVLKGLFMMRFLYFGFPYFSPEFYVLKQKLVRQNVKYSMSYAFIALLVSIKFMELYFNSKRSVNARVSVANIEPPYKDSIVPKGICGICKQKWTNPTALTSSGYIFCYTCIRTHIQIFGACPITKIRTSVKSLRKIHF